MRGVKNIVIFLLCTSLHAQISFEEQSSALGVTNDPGFIILGGGISFVDFDGDGWDDITLPSADGVPLRFYKNFSGYFLEIFPIIPVIDYQTKTVNWLDFDNDGDKDLFVTSDTHGNRLYENTGNLILQNITATSGLPIDNLYTYGVSWGEIDNDGYLDLFISNRIVTGNNIANYLYRNNGDGTFTDVTVASGIAIEYQLTFCSGFLDYNNDGWQDIYIANDKNSPNILYRNNGDSTYTDVSFSTGTGVVMDAMSVTVDDFNSDGFFDIYVTNTYFPISDPGGNVFFRNNGDGTFTDIASSSGTIFNSFAWGSVFLDADNDTDLDLHVSGMFDGSSPGLVSTLFYENIGSETFTTPSNAGFSSDDYSSFANATGDIDNDGKPDIIVYNNNTPPSIYKNTTPTGNNYLGVELEGVTSNKDGVGSVIEIGIEDDKQYRYIMCGEGYMSQNSLKEIFGLGHNTEVDYVKVKWLSGTEDIMYNVQANQVIKVVEGSTLSIQDNFLPKINVFPNPFDDEIRITTYNPLTSLKITNTLGQLIYSEENIMIVNSYKVNLNIPSGLYTLTLETLDNTVKSYKIIKK
ncbi:FG-GAP-like repeat-containing protein [Winogradskyella sp. 3972H.M.0a.05]|uniref:FG-GAP-like repeat-containing protein n=1 Tax=Winogradskyella sp. 3972H.M.0a.05 TaxID=2950277 RepID=UPI003394FA31